MLKRVHWNADAQPYDQTLDRVLYDLRRADPDNLLLDAVSMTDILEDSDGVLLFDAMTTPFARLPRMMEMLKGAMQHFSATVKPLDVTISEPFSARGVANVSAIFSLSDGQNLSVYFHNPDTKPKSIGANDEMISWKWMLNKLDVTIVVAPERGKELNIREVARRIMKLAEKNSAAFQRANGKRAERMKKIEGLKEEVAALEVELTQAQKDLEVAKLVAEERAIEAVGKNGVGAAQETITLTGNELGEFQDTPEGLRAMRKAAADAYDKLIQDGEWVRCPALNADVELRTKGRKKMISSSADTRKLKLVPKLKEIIAGAQKVGAARQNYNIENSTNIFSYQTMRSVVVLDGVELAIRMVLGLDDKGQYHYDHTVHDSDVIFDSAKANGPAEADPLTLMGWNRGRSHDRSAVSKPSRLLSRDPSQKHQDGLIMDEAVEKASGLVLNLFIEGEEPEEIDEVVLGLGAQDVNDQNAGTLTPEGRESKVKTAKGNEVVTGFTVVEADTLITSHDAESGTPNPAFPPELQPRDRGRDTSRAWVIKTAGNLDPEQLGSTRRADTGAPIVGPDGIVESGNGRTMAIVLAYAHGKAAEYRDWLESEAEYFGLSVNKVKAMRKPVLVRVRTSQIDRAAFAVEANQDDKLAMTATEKARADARRLTDDMIALMTDNGDLTAVANQPFLSAFLKSLGDAEAAQYSTSDGKPTSTLIARVQAAIFAKAYNDDRLLELTADAAKPEIANIISALNFAAPEFIQAAALDTDASDAASKKLVDSIETSLNAQAVNAILGATNVLKQAKEAGMQVDEFIKQQGLFADIDPAVAAMAVFISKNNRSGKRMGTAFKAMATFVKSEIQRRQTADMFGAPEPIGFEAIVAAANREMDRVFGEGSFAIEVGDLFASKNDPEPTPEPTEAPTQVPTPQQDPAKAAAIAMMQAIIDGTTDPLTADLDVLEQAFTSYQDDAEVESLFEQAVDVVMQAAAKATEGVTA